MDEATKTKIKAIIKVHLTSLGWPDCPNPNELVMNNLDNIFKILLKENLVKQTDYNAYSQAAVFQYMKTLGV